MNIQITVPSFDEVWRRVVAFARDCLIKDRPIFTVSQNIKNRITDVTERSIGRFSERGTSNSSRINRSDVKSLWSKLQGGDGGSGYLYFTKALVLAALPDVVEDMDGELFLRNSPKLLEIKRARRAANTDGTGFGGGEGETHRKLKEYIYYKPNVALAALKTGPYQQDAMEYVFETGDRVDVVLIDSAGKILLVEVKPFLQADDFAPFAQAAKYRTLWHILRKRPLAEIRCLVAAPKINNSPWKKMKVSHGIECVAVELEATRHTPAGSRT